MDDHAVSYRRLDDHLGCDTCLVCDSSNVRSAREFGSTPNLDAFASPNESRTMLSPDCQLERCYAAMPVMTASVGSLANLGDVYTTMPPLRCSQWFYVFVEA